ncbi:hypothetical protein KCU89_g78, partial [Aureobasidium melanogenum]
MSFSIDLRMDSSSLTRRLSSRLLWLGKLVILAISFSTKLRDCDIFVGNNDSNTLDFTTFRTYLGWSRSTHPHMSVGRIEYSQVSSYQHLTSDEILGRDAQSSILDSLLCSKHCFSPVIAFKTAMIHVSIDLVSMRKCSGEAAITYTVISM